GWGGGWRWRRRLFAWEEDPKRECSAILGNFLLQDNASDKWIRRTNTKEGFTVKETYNILAQAENVVSVEINKTIWNN
ncbi:receptor-like kinase, partial [Trifolium pratense]